MKTIFPVLFLIMLIFPSCEKENEILFDIPMTDWNLTKGQVITIEPRTLIANIEASDIIYLSGPYNNKGDGALKYSDNGYLKEINYGFYCANKTLEEVLCLYEKTNSKPTDQALKYLNSLYGDYTTRSKPTDYSGFSGKVFKFTTDFGIVVLEEYSQTTNRITFTKAQYSVYY